MKKIFQLITIIIFGCILQSLSLCYAQGGGITGKVFLQNRTDQSGLFTFELRQPGKTTSLSACQITIDNEGNYTLSNIPAGIYDLTVKTKSFLGTKKSNVIVDEDKITTGIDFNLSGGDCDGNGVVNIFDHSILNASLGSKFSDANWDERADIDGNGVINIFDHSIQNSNFWRDAIEPKVNITSHANGQIIKNSSKINISGTVDDNQAVVFINGLPASVSNGTFLLENVNLSEGLNTITVTVTDKWGNSAWEKIDVNYQASYKYNLKNLKNYLVYYGSWDETIVSRVNRYDLLILNINRGPSLQEQAVIIDEIQAGLDGISKTEDDVAVLAYISLGEDERTYGFKEPMVGDGKGPCFFDRKTGEIIYENKGIASCYMDEWNVNGPHSSVEPEHDGIPDRHGTWGACYVNAGNHSWQTHIIGVGRNTMPYSCDVIINTVGYDGFFLDTPEVAGPYEGFGWTAQGMHDLIKLIDETYPDKILLLNRGVFFFVPHYKYQYEWCPRKYVDIVLYESYYLDSDYDRNFSSEEGISYAYHYSPYYNENRYFIGPKFNAELGRPDSFCQIVNIDYVSDPENFPAAYPDVYSEVINKSIVEQGRLEFLTNKLVTSLNTTVIDNSPPADNNAPLWLNSTNGLKSIDVTRPYYNALGSDDTTPTPARIGVQKAIPDKGEVTLQWDVAVDQSRPVKYNIYYSENSPINYDTAVCLENVVTRVGGDYTNRGYLTTDDVCPYEYTVTGLLNEETYYFAVRAEDSNSSANNPSTGRIGPGGGVEDTNTKELAAAPRSQVFSIDIDGNFGDWQSVPYYADKGNDVNGAEVDWTGCKITDNEEDLYLYFDCASNINLDNKYVIFLNTDQKSFTGFSPQKGADYMVKGGRLFRYMGNGETDVWEEMYFVNYSYDLNQMEMRLVKSDIKAEAAGIGINIFFYADNLTGEKDYMPDNGASGFSYTYLKSPSDITPPDFDITSFAAIDENIDGTIKLEWNAAKDINLPIKYEIYDKSYNLIETITETSLYLNHLINNKEYTFFVRAVDSQGNHIDSIERKIVPTLNSTPPQWVETTGIQKAMARDSSVKIFWNKAWDESHPPAFFNVYYHTQPITFDGTETKLARVAQSPSDNSNYAWMYSIAGLTNEQQYYFIVRTEDRVGNEDSNSVELSVIPFTPEAPNIETMDGVFNDWKTNEKIVYAGKDTVGDGTAEDNSADITDLWLIDDADYFYLRWQLTGDVQTSNFRYMVFIDTDLDSKTGFLTDWNTVGAEFLLMNGQLMKYTGVDGVADWSWQVLNDNVCFSRGILEINNFELALSRHTLGLTGKDRFVSVWFYISDEVSTTLDECFPAYGKGGFVYQFSQTSSLLRADGNFNDWSSDASVVFAGNDVINDGIRGNGSLSELADSADIKNLWIGDTTDYLYVCWEMCGGVDFDKYTYYVYLDTDSNASTGYKASWGVVGAEYMIANGILSKYAGITTEHTDWSWQAVGQIAIVSGKEDKVNKFEMAVSRALINELGLDERTTLSFAAIDNKETDDFSDDVYDFYPEPGRLFMYSYSQISGTIRIDGSFADWEKEDSVELFGIDPKDDGYDKDGHLVLGQLGLFADIDNVWAVKDNNYLFMKLNFLGDVDFNKGEYTIYFDTDRNSKTGYQTSWGALGAEYRFYNGTFYHYTGAGTNWEWECIEGAYYAIGVVDKFQMEAAVDRQVIGWSDDKSIKIFIMASDKKGEGWEDDVTDFLPELGKAVIYPYIPLSDLKIKSVTCTPAGNLRQGESAVVSVEIENIGSMDAEAFKVNIWIDGTAQTSKTIAGLAKGSASTVTFNWTAGQQPKTLWIGAKADSGNEVDEEDEDNNEGGLTIKIEKFISGLLTIDGNFSDWEGQSGSALVSQDMMDDGYDKDGNLLLGQLGFFADIDNVWIISDNSYLFMRLNFLGDIDFAKGEYSIYLDVDRNNSTGYKASWGALGAEYRFYNGSLYHYTGAGTDWAWEFIEGAYYALGMIDKFQMEAAVDRQVIGWSDNKSIRIFITASDKKGEGWEDDITDFLPESSKAIVYPEMSLSDLKVKTVSCSTVNLKTGDSTVISVEVENIGEGDAGSFEVNIWIDGTAQTAKTIAGLAKGSASIVTFNWTAGQPKTLWIGAKADSSLQVDEKDEGNNENGVEVKVQEFISGLLAIDGDFADWDAQGSVELIGTDGIDDGYNKDGNLAEENLGAFADMENVWAVKDNNYLFMRLDFLGNINFNQAEYTIYIDIDRSNTTGYQTSWGALGADYRFYNGSLYRYTGTGTSWDWETSQGAYYAIGTIDKSQIEIAVEKGKISWSNEESIKLFITASDKKGAGWEDDISDFLPEKGSYNMYCPVIPSCDLKTQIVDISPVVPMSGCPADIKAAIKNIHPSNSSISCDAALWIDGVKMAVQRINSISAGSSVNVSFSWTPPSAKTFWAVISVDDKKEVNETDKTNNNDGLNITVALDPPDLTVTAINLSPQNPQIGISVIITGVVKNIGDVDPGSFNVYLWINGINTDVKTIDGLGEKESKEVIFNWTPVKKGDAWIGISADGDNKVIEIGAGAEENNDYGISVSVN